MSAAMRMTIQRGWQRVSLSLAKLSPGLRWMLLLTLLACVVVALEEPAASSASAGVKPAPEMASARAAVPAGDAAVAAGAGGAAGAAGAAGAEHREHWPTLPPGGAAASHADPALQPWPALTAQTMLAWAPPPPPPPPSPMARVQVVVPAGPPPAPAFPYRMIGRMDIDGSPHAVLSNGKDSFEVAPARVLDGNWRVEVLNDAGLQMTWIPSGQKISVGFAR